MLDLKELEKFLQKAGKHQIIWERDEEYNYVSNKNILVQFPRYDALSNEDSEMFNFFVAEEKEKLLKCERILFYYFMTPPEKNQSLKKYGNVIQFGIEATLDKLLYPDEIQEVEDTGLLQNKGTVLSIFATEDNFYYFERRYVDLIESSDGCIALTNNKALLHTDAYISILIGSIVMKENNSFLRLKYNEEIE